MLYLGWFIGNPATLHVLPPVESSKRYVDMMGGVEALISKANDYYGSDRVEIARQKLSDAVSLGDQLQMWLRLTFVELELGNESAALNTLAEVERFFERTRNHFLPKDVAEVRFRFGMVHLRHGETQNCCMLRNKDSCLLPIRDGGIHTREGGSRAAVNEFKKVVNLVPRNSKRYLETAWLWNLASMTLGEHPQGVPEQYRMDPERFLSQEEFPRLRNIATKLGLDTNSLCGSVVADDILHRGSRMVAERTARLRARNQGCQHRNVGAQVPEHSCEQIFHSGPRLWGCHGRHD